MKRTFAIESLESRTLFAGVIVEANGRLGPIDTFMPVMASSIAAHVGGLGNISEYILTVDASVENAPLVASISHVDGTGTPQTTTSGEIIILLNYYNVSANAAYSSTYIGAVAADYMMNNPVNGVALASLPIQLIGLSRGAGIMDGMAKEFGTAGVWVDQETYLDPDPIAAQQDPPPTLYSNVAFADDYWRDDGLGTVGSEGQAVTGAYNLNIDWVNTDDAGWGVSAHLVPSGYYIGTIDQNATQSGWGPIYSSWYGTTPLMPARNATGFIYTSLIGAARPLSGVWTASGGTGTRTDPGESGSQWGNITDLAITSGDTVTSNGSINVSYIEQDRDSGDTVTFHLGTDRNPFDNSFVATLGTTTLAQSSAITQQTQSLNLGNIAPGTYWLCAQITDPAGNTRYAYQSITAPLTVKSTASVSGKVFSDLNGNGVQDSGEPGIAGRMVYIDLGGTGQFQSGDPSATTDANGNYTIFGLQPGTYTVREVVPAGETETAAPSAVTVSAGQMATLSPFATTPPPATLTGTVFDDVDGNGVQDNGEPGVPGVLVYVDLNGSGQYQSNDPSATTDANGNYSITGLLPDVSYTLQEVVSGGDRVTAAPSSVTPTPGQVVTLSPFGLTETAEISGTVVVQDLAGSTLSDSAGGFQIDLAEHFSRGRPVTLDTITNASGNYSFSVVAGSHDTLQIVKRKGFKTAPHSRTAYTVNNISDGQSITGMNFVQLSTVAPVGSAAPASVSGIVTVQNPLGTTSPDSAADFEIILAEHFAKGKPVKLTTTTAADGSFTFSDVVPGGHDTLQIVKRKGFKAAPHSRTTYAVKNITADDIITGLNFVQVPIVTASSKDHPQT